MGWQNKKKKKKRKPKRMWSWANHLKFFLVWLYDRKKPSKYFLTVNKNKEENSARQWKMERQKLFLHYPRENKNIETAEYNEKIE